MDRKEDSPQIEGELSSACQASVGTISCQMIPKTMPRVCLEHMVHAFVLCRECH